MVCIRRASMADLLQIHDCSSTCHPGPETYAVKYVMYHLLSWPAAQHVAQDYGGRIVGCVLSVIIEEGGRRYADVTSLAVLRAHRRLGIATRLMYAAHAAMEQVYGAEYVSLHLRMSNRAAFKLYTQKLGYEMYSSKPKFYQDGEDGCEMRKLLNEGQSHWRQHGGGASEARSETERDKGDAGTGEVKFVA